MSIIYILIPIAILFVIIAIGVFFWAVKSEQFSDLNKQGHSILFEDDKEQHNKSNDRDKSI
ncbi:MULTISPECIES: cbb3-type cytochrome oxidase assembly protein CcoS [Pseudoalteromonas]|uniref:Cbb3-type cytochrome oxidase assembly protein CcoS n=13 Tax=root TaxID=1 RepID=A0A0L0ENU1_9GAMM|nr:MULTISPECIES: cbb3-type cytochrome oxidase assembly protein CcoS [Pseudoalteromonas]ALU41644.1 cytochrome C oxidase Cbb3 [Pseudoalteromonas rubra]KNC66069.1 cytochrome oxidase maturation protein Cbb3 [Pseudoalteromonas rubra]MCG7535892.1 cbb3-type cytochrome oxidase assembly protein CcoS [Pseudoalteromonas sp. OOF1S-7]MCG7560917.1 cbb3-type cytochrome oxidase assembly protein CcoS [Pseudoalteromonas sp. McH1-42]MDK1313640.1 cbb3-type cytochrome oxidase assembly protein CcoS [Pseudoalteromon